MDWKKVIQNKPVIQIVIIFLSVIFLLFAVLWITVPTCSTDYLVRLYYIGGIISGIFAFGAFWIATITYHNQKKNGNLQRFETTFFNMLELQQQMTNELTYEGQAPSVNPMYGEPYEMKCVTKHGREIFEYFWFEKYFYDKRMPDGRISLDGEWYEGMATVLTQKGSEGYDQFVEVSLFDHYFRHLYRIIKFIDTTDLLENDGERYEYTSIVRATLSRFELVWLYYNCLFGFGKSKFKSLIEKYALLKNLRDELLTVSKDVIDKGYFAKYKIILYDYEAHLTDQIEEESRTDKYYIGAFFNSRDNESFSKAKEEFRKSPAAQLD